MRLSVAIQHHPSRADALSTLLGRLGVTESRVDVVDDPSPLAFRSPWRTAQKAWASTPSSATHRLLLQDDVIPCDDFLDLAERALAEKPDELVTFYVGRYPGTAARLVLQALDLGMPWIDIGMDAWTPCLALAMPTAMALDLATHTDRHHYPAAMCADDGIVSLWRQDRGNLACWATIPSLVDHDNDVESLMGSGFAGDRIAIVAHPTLPHHKNRLGSADLRFC